MRRAGGLIAVLVFAGTLHGENAPLRVDESGIRVRLRDGVSEVSIPVHSGSVRSTHLWLEWLDPAGRQQAVHDAEISLRGGSNPLSILFPLPGNPDELTWYRLHYRIDGAFPSVEPEFRS
jgi:hypothetical protein